MLQLDAVTRNYLELLTERMPRAVFAYEIPARRIIFLNPAFDQNPAFQRMVQKSQENGREGPAFLLALIHPDDQAKVEKACQELVTGISPKEMEFRIPVPGHPECWVYATAFLLEEQQAIVGYADDITAQKQYHDNLKKFSDKKNSILNILSHDLAGPLSKIQGLATLLEEDLKLYENQEILKLIGLIEKNSKEAIQLIQEFIRQEFLETANVDLLKRRVNLVEEMKEIMEQYQQSQQLTGKTFHYLTSSDHIFIDLDDNKFMQAVNNLISNAIKFTPDGGKITVELAEKETSVLIKVQDNGIGIPEKYHAALFEKFTKARRPGIKGEPSVGLGMSIIKTIVEWHQGKIWFESEENKGTCFYIQIPKS